MWLLGLWCAGMFGAVLCGGVVSRILVCGAEVSGVVFCAAVVWGCGRYGCGIWVCGGNVWGLVSAVVVCGAVAWGGGCAVGVHCSPVVGCGALWVNKISARGTGGHI